MEHPSADGHGHFTEKCHFECFCNNLDSRDKNCTFNATDGCDENGNGGQTKKFTIMDDFCCIPLKEDDEGR